MALTQQQFNIILQARDATGAAFASAQKGIAGVQEAAISARSVLASFGVSIGALAIQQQIRGAVDELGKVGDIAGRVNATTDAVQAMQMALTLNGGQAGDAEVALQKFAIAAAEVGKNANYLTKIFQANGVALRDANGHVRSSDALLQDYARLVANAGDAQTKLLLAQEAFGKSAGPRMVAVLEEMSRNGMQSMIDQGVRLGVIFDTDLIKRSQELDKSFKLMEMQGTAAFKRLAVEWAPQLKSALDEIAVKLKDIAYTFQLIANGRYMEAIGISIDKTQTWQQRAVEAFIVGRGNTNAFTSREIYGSTPDEIDQMNRRRLLATRGQMLWSESQSSEFNRSFFSRTGPGNAGNNGNSGRPTALPPRTDPQNRTSEVVEWLRLEGAALTLNLDKKREAERLEAQINAIRRAGKDISDQEKESIRGAVDALYAKKKAFDELKLAQDAFNDALKFSGEQIFDTLSGIIGRTKTWEQATKDVEKALISAALRAAILGEGPLAGMFGMKGKNGMAGGAMGAFFNWLSPAAQVDPWAGIVPGRASGGPVQAGHAYTVGERGQEKFVPFTDGIIIPNNAMGGGGQLSVRIVNQGPPVEVTGQRMNDSGELELTMRAVVRDEMASPRTNGITRQKYGQSPTLRTRS